MKKIIVVILLFFAQNQSVFSQNITVHVIDSITLKPIPNVAVKFSENSGKKSNFQGAISFDRKNRNTLHFSCLGYNSKTILIRDIIKQNYMVLLTEKSILLNEIRLKTHTISLDSLLINIKKNLSKNYYLNDNKYHVFGEQKNKVNLKKIVFELNKSSIFKRNNHKKANEELSDFLSKIKKDNTTYQINFTGNFKTANFTVPNTKEKVQFSISNHIKAHRNTNNYPKINIENVQEKILHIVLKFLNKNYTYKVKSGFFKVEDSLSIKSIVKKINDTKNTYSTNSINSISSKLIGLTNFFTNKTGSNFLNASFYKYQLKNSVFLDDDLVYVVRFFPKTSKAKYEGNIYINPTDFAIKKVVFNYAKGKKGEHLNLKFLLGVKFSEFLNSGVIKYQKDSIHKYNPSYVSLKNKKYFYVNRPFKFKENSKEKKKTKFTLQFEGVYNSTSEIILTKTTTKIKRGKIEKLKRFLSKKEYNLLCKKNNYLNALEKERIRYKKTN